MLKLFLEDLLAIRNWFLSLPIIKQLQLPMLEFHYWMLSLPKPERFLLSMSLLWGWTIVSLFIIYFGDFNIIEYFQEHPLKLSNTNLFNLKQINLKENTVVNNVVLEIKDNVIETDSTNMTKEQKDLIAQYNKRDALILVGFVFIMSCYIFIAYATKSK